MSLIRSIRSLSHNYKRETNHTSESEELLASYVIMNNANSIAKSQPIYSSNIWPENIILNAHLKPRKEFQNIYVNRKENEEDFGQNFIYQNPIIHHKSTLNKINSFCTSICVNFENSGYIYTNKKEKYFMNNIFMDYEINIKDNLLLEKHFLSLNQNVIENYTKHTNSPKTITGTNILASYNLYPYGGFFENGIHPKEIESCFFQINSSEATSAIKISTYSNLMKIGVDPSAKTKMANGNIISGVSSLTKNHKMNLYDEIINNACKIQIKNIKNNEIKQYVSNNLIHIPNTNLIQINFIRESNELQ